MCNETALIVAASGIKSMSHESLAAWLKNSSSLLYDKEVMSIVLDEFGYMPITHDTGEVLIEAHSFRQAKRCLEATRSIKLPKGCRRHIHVEDETVVSIECPAGMHIRECEEVCNLMEVELYKMILKGELR